MNYFGLVGPGAELAWWTIAVGAIVNTACALLGCFLVLRRMSLLGDAISHAVLPGLVLAYLLAGRTAFGWLFLGAMATGILTSLLVQTLTQWGGVPEDASMGAVFTTLFSVGVLLLSNFARDVHLDASCVLYGEIEYVALDVVPLGRFDVPRVLPTTSAALFAVIAFLRLFRKELKLSSFDPALATAMGFSAATMHYLLMGMTAVVTVAAFEAIGSILAVAMLIVPAATAHLLTDRLRTMLVWSAAAACGASLLGYLAARVCGANVAGMMAVATGLEFALAVVFAPRHGIVAKAWRSLLLSLRIAGEDVLARLYRGEEAAARPALAAEIEPEPSPTTPRTWITALAIGRLLRGGQLRRAADGALELTDAGRRDAESIVRSHRLWEAYLVEHFQLPLDHLHEPAERIEHFIGPELQQQLAESLSKAAVDPHGREIPPPKPPDATGSEP